MSDDIIKRALGMEITETGEDQNAVVVYEESQEVSDDVTEDFEYVIDNLKDLI